MYWLMYSENIACISHMNICAFGEGTFYHHQKKLLIPATVKFWQSYQDKMFKSLSNKDVVLAGDGRHDSAGHSAKFGTCTIFCCTVGLILHLVVVQVYFGSCTSVGHFIIYMYLSLTMKNMFHFSIFRPMKLEAVQLWNFMVTKWR